MSKQDNNGGPRSHTEGHGSISTNPSHVPESTTIQQALLTFQSEKLAPLIDAISEDIDRVETAQIATANLLEAICEEIKKVKRSSRPSPAAKLDAAAIKMMKMKLDEVVKKQAALEQKLLIVFFALLVLGQLMWAMRG